MADRMPVVRVPPRVRGAGRGTIIVDRGGDGGFTDPPMGPWPESPTPREHSTVNTHRRGSQASQRQQTFQGAQGVVPWLYGGTINVGGAIIYQNMVANTLYLDLHVSKGEILDCGIPQWNRQYSAAAVNASYYNHVGATGDTGMNIINAIDGTYAVPEGTAHVEFSITQPTATTPAFNPLDIMFKDAQGRLIYDPRTSTYGWSTNPVLVVWDLLTVARKIPFTRLYLQDWLDEADYCDSDPGDATKMWEFSWRFDTRDTIQNQINFVLAHCAGHLRDVNGKIGIWLDRIRDKELDAASQPIIFCDNDDGLSVPANLAGELNWSTKNREQTPSIVVGEYSDYTAGDVDASTSYPLIADLDVNADYIERRLRIPGINKIDMADRRVLLEYNISNLDRDIIIPCFRGGLVAAPGNRVQVDSRLLMPAGSAPPNTGATNGLEEVLITDQKISDVIVLRASLYRDATYGPVGTPGTPPTPGDPPPGIEPPVPPPGGGGGGGLAYIQNLSDAEYALGAQIAQFSVTNRGRVGMLALGGGSGYDWSAETQIDNLDISSLGGILTAGVVSANVILTGVSVDGAPPRSDDVFGIMLEGTPGSYSLAGGSLTLQHDNGVDSFFNHRFHLPGSTNLVLNQDWQFAAFRYWGGSSIWRLIWKNF